MNARWIRLMAVTCLTATAASAEEASVFVVIENPTGAELSLKVEDEVCSTIAFEGMVEPSSILTLALCPDEHGLAQLVLTNVATGQISERGVPSGGSVVAP